MFINYETDSGEIFFIKRDSITSFHPKYVDRNKYIVYCTVGKETYPLFKSSTVKEAKDWVVAQIKSLEVAVK